MRSSSGRINIAVSARKLDVDNRISLRYYYRIADNILKQADIFREEKNIIDLYIMLLRFSSLASETIPHHRDYRASLQSNKNFLKKKLLNALTELEELQPVVQQKIDELNRKHTYQVNGWDHPHQNGSFDSSLEWPPPIKKQSLTSYGITKTPRPAGREFVHQGSSTQQFLHAKPANEQFRRLSLNIPRAKEETLSRHSILGPNGLRGQWQPPSSDKGVQYPSNIDLTPIEILRENSLQLPVENGVLIEKDTSNLEHDRSSLESILPLNDDKQMHDAEKPHSLISFETIETAPQTDIVRQPSPPPVLADVQDLIPASPPLTEAEHVMENPSSDGLVCSESPLQLHISTTLMDSFMKLAKSNTDKNLETCGVLAGSLKNRKFYITALIIPKQESTSNSCETTNEEEIFEVQDKRSLFPLGWIHTHPTQSCFMSSIDLHTHYSYQIMLPESIAIVMAPRDSSRTHGIFRLTAPGGMTVIRQCPRRGFHPHDPPPDGGPIYQQCTDVYMNPNIKFDVIDLR
uniref:Putative AMSH-like ubiquitin thioesterase 1 n=2 Tax=Davidia involucrata TaxID=16924 RepID=A0A5B7A343_DAVIN